MNYPQKNTIVKPNILPYDGIVNYDRSLFCENEAQKYLEVLLHTIEWKNDETIIFGKKILTKRKVAWYGDKAYKYSYSKTTKFAQPWTKELLQLKEKLEKHLGETFNSCLLNLYHNGEEGMGWHSDNEADLKKQATIASLSFGAERKFIFKHKDSKEKVALILENGSLLVMKNNTQENWLHSLPPTKKIKNIRINLTFRSIKE